MFVIEKGGKANWEGEGRRGDEEQKIVVRGRMG